MPNTANNIVLWNDGEQITYGDLNDMQTFHRALLLDEAIGSRRGVLNGTDAAPYSGLIYASGAAGSIIPTAATGVMTVNNPYGGMLYQWTGASSGSGFSITSGTTYNYNMGAPDGITPGLLAYRLSAAELSYTVPAAPAAGSERFDLIAVQLTAVAADSQERDFKDAVSGAVTSQVTNKKTRVQLSAQYISGPVEPSGSGFYPALPAGYAPLAIIYVPGGATQVTTASIYDHRVPFGTYRQVWVNGDKWMDTQGQWGLSGVGIRYAQSDPAITKTAYAIYPGPSYSHGRVVGYYLQPTYVLLSGYTPTPPSVAILSRGEAAGANVYENAVYGLTNNFATVTDLIYPKTPVWTNGATTPLIDYFYGGGPFNYTSLALSRRLVAKLSGLANPTTVYYGSWGFAWHVVY